MVAKVFKLNKQSASSVKRLCAYLMDTQNDPHRVEAFQLTNCLDGYLEPEERFTEEAVEDAANEMACVQRGCLNSQSRDLTYHFILSWRPGEEVPDTDVWKAVEEACSALGASGLQRLAVIHGDTDTRHVHVCLNRVDPVTRKARNFRNDYAILAKTCQKLEREMHFQADNHQKHSHAVGTAANSMEFCGDLESFTGYCQRGCRDTLLAAITWKEFHATCARYGICYQIHGRGATFSDAAGHHCKASAVDRRLSLASLQKKLGSFMEAGQQCDVKEEHIYEKKPMDYGCVYTGDLWNEYQAEKNARQQDRKTADEEAWQEFQREVASICSTSAEDVLFNYMVRERTLRLVRRWLRDAERRRKIQNAARRMKKTRHDNRSRCSFPSWSDWLQKKAARGDMRALAAMQARDNRKHVLDRTMNERNTLEGPPQNDFPCKVTRKGARLYASGLREYKGKYLFRETEKDSLLKEFLRWAGKTGIKLTSGSMSFIARVFDIADESESPIEFLHSGMHELERSLRQWDTEHGVNQKLQSAVFSEQTEKTQGTSVNDDLQERHSRAKVRGMSR